MESITFFFIIILDYLKVKPIFSRPPWSIKNVFIVTIGYKVPVLYYK